MKSQHRAEILSNNNIRFFEPERLDGWFQEMNLKQLNTAFNGNTFLRKDWINKHGTELQKKRLKLQENAQKITNKISDGMENLGQNVEQSAKKILKQQ